MIKGNIVELVPASLEERMAIYEWLCNSDVTASMMGPPDFVKLRIPTWDEFCEDYVDCYFDGSQPAKGKVFMIVTNNVKVGCISYTCFHLNASKAELDIWMKAEANCGKGFGTDAIIILCNYLKQFFQIEEFIIRPSIKNIRAIRSYQKAGFSIIDKNEEEIILKNFLKDEYFDLYSDGDYGKEGTVTLVKML